jgi:DNA invertase Pin-like site-specific DNA recombinase
MEKVVILARVSTDKQDYQRQIVELTDYCSKVGWEIVKVFANKISGAKKTEERPEILEMLSYVKEHAIKRVCCLEVSRLGRNTLEALKVIQMLNDNKVSLFIKNYNLETLNPDGTPNPITSLITTILLEIASMERLTIRERMVSGQKQYISKCKREGIKMGRPSGTYKDMDTYREQYSNEISLLKKGVPVRTISLLTSTSVNTIQKIKKLFITKEL